MDFGRFGIAFYLNRCFQARGVHRFDGIVLGYFLAGSLPDVPENINLVNKVIGRGRDPGSPGRRRYGSAISQSQVDCAPDMSSPGYQGRLASIPYRRIAP